MPKSERIPVGKKRYTLTLTEKTMTDMQGYLKEKHAPASLISAMLDEQLAAMLRTVQELETVQERTGQPAGLADVLGVLSTIMKETTDKQGRLM